MTWADRPLRRMKVIGPAATPRRSGRASFGIAAIAAELRAYFANAVSAMAITAAASAVSVLPGQGVASFFMAPGAVAKATYPAAGSAALAISAAAAVNPSNAADMLANYADGLAFKASDDSMVVKHVAVPANNYVGTPGGKFTTVRASSKYVWNAAGTVIQLGNNVLARDFDPRLLGACGYLIEEQRSNLCRESYTLHLSPWTDFTAGAGVTPIVTGNAGNDIRSANAASRVQLDCGDAGSATNRSMRKQDITVSNGAAHAGVVWYKAYDAAAIGKTIRVSADNLSGGAVLTLGATWQRYEITGTSSSTSISLNIETRGTYTTQTADALICACKLEAGPFATSDIPTTSASATRAADVVTLARSAFPWADGGSTLYCSFTPLFASASSDFNCLISVENTNSNRVFIGKLNTALYVDVIAGGAGSSYQTSHGLAGFTSLMRTKIAFAFSANAIVAKDGAAATEDNSVTAGFTMDILRIGDDAGGRKANGWLHDGMVLPQRVSNAEAQGFTS